MKKLILTLFLFSGFFANSQYCTFFDFEAKEPEMVVSTLKGMMETGWGKNIQGTKSFLRINLTEQIKQLILFNFVSPTKSFCFFFSTWAMSVDAQLFGEKLGKFSEPVSQSLNTPVWYKNDWSNDNAFMLYQMEVNDPAAYLKEFKSFSQKMAKKLGFEK